MTDILSKKIKYIIEQQNTKNDGEENPPEKEADNQKIDPAPTEEQTPNDESNMNQENPETTDSTMGDNDDGSTNTGNMGDPMNDDGNTPSLEQIGRVYELKQLYNRLISIRNHISIFVEDEFDEIKKILSKAIDLFDIVINNYNQYDDKIDDIIVMYYNFISAVYEDVRKKYKKYSKNKNNNTSPFETNLDKTND